MTTPEPPPHGIPGTDPTLGPPASDRPGPPPGTSAGPVTPAPSAPPAAKSRHTGRTIGRTLGLVLLLFVTVVLVLFVVFNTQTVDISLVFGNVQAPLVLALLIAAALGGLLVLLIGAVLRARRSRD